MKTDRPGQRELDDVGVAGSGMGGIDGDWAWPPPGPRRRPQHQGRAIAAVVAVAAATAASVLAFNAVQGTRTTPTSSSLAAAVGGHAVTSAASLRSAIDAYQPGNKTSVAWADLAGHTHTAAVVFATGPAD